MGCSGIYKYILLLVISALLSCKSSSKLELAEELPNKIPFTIIVERVISGNLLGEVLKFPVGLAVDSRGVIYCVDQGNKRVIQFSSEMIPVREFGGAGAASGLFGKPGYITIDKDLNIIISDESNQRISKYNSNLNFVDEFPFYDSDDPLKFGYPSGMGITDFGELWVADISRDRIAVFNNVGIFEKFVGEFGFSGQQLRTPMKIIADIDNNFIVCDAGNNRLVLYDDNGDFVTSIGTGEFDFPSAAYSVPEGLWVLDGKTGRINFLSNEYQTVLTSGPKLSGNDTILKEPSDIIVLPNKQVVISDSGNDRLLICRVVYN